MFVLFGTTHLSRVLGEVKCIRRAEMCYSRLVLQSKNNGTLYGSTWKHKGTLTHLCFSLAHVMYLFLLLSLQLRAHEGQEEVGLGAGGLP